MKHQNSQKALTIALFLVFVLILAPIAQAADASSTPLVNVDTTLPPLAVSGLTLALLPDESTNRETTLNGLIFNFGQIKNTASLLVNISTSTPTTSPWQLKLSSLVYTIKIDQPLTTSSSFTVSQTNAKAHTNYYSFMMLDAKGQNWLPIVTKDDPLKRTHTAVFSQSKVTLAIFEYPGLIVSGKASWYKYKAGLFAASPDFPKGSKLRVYNLDAPAKYVDVTINDYGPDRVLHPDRVLDLDKEAFRRIAPTGQGMARIAVMPLNIVNVKNNYWFNTVPAFSASLKITSKSAVVIDAKTNRILWTKNATTSLPIASLSKVISAYVFLETKPTFNRVVAYSVKDENYNYLYANKGDVARLKVKDGEKMTVENLFYSALVGSANNAVESLVRVSGLTRERFIARMNEVASEWGAVSSHFVEPTGLSPENVSSALDYAIMSNKALSHPIIEKATKVKSYSFKTITTKEQHTIRNTNQLIRDNRLRITGSKTGFLYESLYCLLTRAEDAKNHSVLVVTLGTPSREASFAETEVLARMGLNQIQ
ncbi:MAG: RlpA-like double-psi beta-barrel domain-containing protein [Candidatus Falkowbacteria bacterium]